MTNTKPNTEHLLTAEERQPLDEISTQIMQLTQQRSGMLMFREFSASMHEVRRA